MYTIMDPIAAPVIPTMNEMSVTVMETYVTSERRATMRAVLGARAKPTGVEG